MINNIKLDNKKNKIGDWNIFYFETIDSTNEEAKRLCQTYRKGKFIVVSNSQSHGKGRYSKSWTSPNCCGLYASWFLLNYNYKIGLLPFVVGLSCISSLKEITKDRVLLKWPNDLIIENKKLGGILIEIFNNSVIVGIGINLFPNDLLPPSAISLCEINKNLNLEFKVLRDSVLYKITRELENYFFKYESDFVFNELSNYLIPKAGTTISIGSMDDL